MTEQPKQAVLADRLRAVARDIRRKPYPISDIIPLLNQAADALTTQPAAQAVVAKAQVPMTDEQLCEALGIDGSDDWTYKVRDIVEAHHGITAPAGGEGK